MDLTTSQRSTRPGAIDDQETAVALLDSAIRRAWATSEPRLLVVRVGAAEAQKKLLEQLLVHAQATGAWALDAEANVVGLDGPYAPIARALTSLAPRLATEPGPLGAAIRHRLQQSVAPLGRLLVSLCPAFAQLVPTSTEIEELSCGFAQERFETLLVRVVAALSPPDRSMVFFLRDADEADLATLRSLSRILAHGETRQFVVVALVGSRSKPRTNDAWTAFCAGRRYVVERFEIGSSHTESSDEEPISGTYATQLSPETCNAIVAAACSGQTAETDAIAAALEISAQGVHEHLRPALEAGLLSRKGSSYVFTDARAARTWHDSINARAAGTMHLRLGQWLALKTDPKVADRQFVSIVHLKYAVDGGATEGLAESERERLAEVMVGAASRAMQVAAYDVADEILARAAQMFAPNGDIWTLRLVDLARRIEFARFECACAVGDRSRAEERLVSLHRHAADAAEMPAAERTMVDLLTRLGAFAAAVEHAARVLAPLGIRIETAPSRQTLDLAFESVWGALDDRAIEELAELDTMTNPQALRASEMLFAVHPGAQALGGGAADLVACHLARLGLLHGNAGASSVGYAAFGAAIIGRNKDHRTGYRFGKVATNLCEQRGTHRHHTAVSMKFAAAMSIWTHPLQTSLEQCARTYETAMISGDSRAASRLAAMIALLALLEGAPLDEVGEEALRRRRAVRSQSSDDEGMGELCDAIERFVGQQKGRAAQRKATAETSPTTGRIGHLACRVLDLMSHVLGHEYDAALAESAALRPQLLNVGAQLIVPEYLFWGALASTLPRSAGCPEGLDEVIDDFEKWADRCPQTFQHKHALLLAERCRLQGLDLDAMRAYDQAISEARENGFTHLEAVAAEAATRFYTGRDFVMIATTYFRAARNAYARWGAPHKVAQLDRRFPKLAGNTELATSPPPSMRGSMDVDIFTALKTAQSVSKEIVLQRLLVTLMRIVLEHGGAERCHVLLEHGDGELNHAGKAVTTSKGVDIEVPGPVAKHLGDILPASIIEHVRRTRESVNIDDATTDREWADDPHIANTRPRSILCFPIMRQTDLVGMFYLENNSARAAFTPRRLALLEFLATQASISLEHAKLYADLARENAERSRAEQVLRKSEQTLRDKLEIIERQKNDIRALSTPLLDVADHIVAMPILGELDEERASRIMDILLDTITKRSVRCAILDLTGVSSIGEGTAEQISRIVRAVELVGARAIVAGIRADVARAFIALDMGLGHVETRATMKDALRQVQSNGGVRKNPIKLSR